ncbi:hypothetical protein B0H13DRAFT_2334701 [Mycena leptocephala]|nr:hypothetical protein B0H13DRAFT_2334701 [Mycena leptocephala]
MSFRLLDRERSSLCFVLQNPLHTSDDDTMDMDSTHDIPPPVATSSQRKVTIEEVDNEEEDEPYHCPRIYCHGASLDSDNLAAEPTASFPPTSIPAPPIFVYQGRYPLNPCPNQLGGIDYVMALNINFQLNQDLLIDGFQRAISYRGSSLRVSMLNPTVFDHDHGLLVLHVQDFMFLQNAKGDGDATKDVCISAAFSIAELGPNWLEHAKDLQVCLIGANTDATSVAPSTVCSDNTFVHVGGTAFEHNHCSNPIDGTLCTVPVTVTPEGWSPCSHGWEQVRLYSKLSAELAAEGLRRFRPVGLVDIFQ